MSELKKIDALVISNCQAAPIKQFLPFFFSNINVTSYGVHVIGQNRSEKIRTFIERISNKVDIVMTSPLSSEFEGLGSAKIRNSFPRSELYNISNFFFEGLHPDICYIGNMGTRIKSPIGDYHSKIAIFSYINGLSVKEAMNQFNGKNFQKIKYFEKFDESFANLVSRHPDDKSFFEEKFIELVRAGPCFFTVNHPTAFLFFHYLEYLQKRLGSLVELETIDHVMDWRYFPNPLSESCIYPVYPEVAEEHNLQYSGCYHFKGGSNSEAPQPISLEEFIEGEYKIMNSIPMEILNNFTQVKRIREELMDLF